MITRLFPAACVAVTLATSASAFDINMLSEDERDAFRAEIRAYLLDNPEVLMEAIGVLEERQANEQTAADATLLQVNADALFNDAQSWVGGNPDGDITLVEFTDYRCAYCRRAHSEVAELVKSDGNIRFIVKEFPILGEDSVLSSRFAIATLQAAGPEAYKKAHDELISFRGNVNLKNLEKLAGRLGLDAKDIMTRMNSEKVTAVIRENHALGQRMQISGTPTFVVQNQILRGYLPLEDMRGVVKEVRTE